ncbi:MAG TPA: recombinase family protein [Thermoanaerobaculia bacterium]|jgi:DNA invertase Pin-like site-specific DNA recombinase
MPRAAIYARRSTDAEDKQVQSLPAQLYWARDICARNEIVDPLVFEERRSAKTPGRPEFNRLLSLIQKGEVDTVICWKADRLARNALDGGSILYALESKKLGRIITSDRIYMADQADEHFVLHLELGLSAKFSKDLSKNTKRGMEEKWRNGEWTGIAPLGYLNRRDERNHGTIVVDGRAAPYVRKLFELAATGNYSLLRLATIAEEEWRLNFIRRRRMNSRRRGIPLNTIQRILRNPFYVGMMRIKDRLIPGSHAPLINKALFDRVQDVLAGRYVAAERPQTKSFPYSGLIRCGGCGRRLTAYTKVKPSGRSYTYYICSNRSKKRCSEPQIVEHEFTAAIESALLHLVLPREEKELCLRMVEELATARRATAGEERNRLLAEIDVFERQNKRLLDLLVEGAISQPDYNFKRAELNEQLASAQMKVRVFSEDLEQRIELARAFISGLPEGISEFQTTDAEGKKEYVRRLGLELVAQDKKVHVHAEKPTAILMDRSALPIWGQLVNEVMTYFLETSTPRFFGAAHDTGDFMGEFAAAA